MYICIWPWTFLLRSNCTNKQNTNVFVDATLLSLAAVSNTLLLAQTHWSLPIPIHLAELFSLFSSFQYVYSLFEEKPDIPISLFTDNMLVYYLYSTGHAKWKTVSQPLMALIISFTTFFKQLSPLISINYISSDYNPADVPSRQFLLQAGSSLPACCL